MAGTVATDLQFFSGITGGGSQSDCDADTDWTGGSPTLDSEVYIEGAGALSEKVSKATFVCMFALAAALDLSDTLIFVWMNCATPGFLDTKALGGLRIRVDSDPVAGTNWGEWYVGGNDTYAGGWECFVVRTNQAFNNTGGTPVKSSVDHVGVVCKTTAAAAKDNFWWDGIRYGTYLEIYGGTSGDPATFGDIMTAEGTNSYGAFIEKEGVLMCQSKLNIGSTTAGQDTYFKDTSKVLVFRDRAFGTFYEIKGQGNATGDTQIYFGVASGGRGVSGLVIRSAGASKFKLTMSDANIDNLGLYGCSFYDADTITLPLYSANKEVLSCGFEACADVVANTGTVKYCNFVSADDNAITISSTTLNTKYCNFINPTNHGIEMTLAGEYNFYGLMFYGTSATGPYDVENTTAGAITINNLDDSNTQYAENTGGGSTTIITAKPVDVHVEDTGGAAIQYAMVYIQRDPATAYTSDTGNTAGDPDFVVNETVDTDQPQDGWIRAWRKSDNALTSFRYTSWTGSTFSLLTEITGTVTTAGSPGATQLIDSAADFGGADDVVIGDAIRNTTDGSWALIDEVVSTTELLTTPLRDGTDNEWDLNDGYSVHRLPITYADNDDLVDIPLTIVPTDAGGDIATYQHNYSTDEDIVVRIRYQEAATKYIPFSTTGTITNTGYTLTAVLQEDEVA